MSASSLVSGSVRPQFAAVRDAFEYNFRKRGEVGASLCVYLEGERVVDLWGGVADKETGEPWKADTLGVMFSATKGLAATCLLMLHDRGQLDYDATVASYWPEFAQAGKQDITVRQMLNHTAGVVGVERPISLVDLEDIGVVAKALEVQKPLWEPGSRQGYHGVTYGLFVAVLFRKITGISIGTFLRDEVAKPLEADVFLGLPASEDGRVATTYPQGKRGLLKNILPRLFLSRGTEGKVYRSVVFDKTSFTGAAFRNPADLGARGVQNFNRTRVRRQELAWANAMGSARGLARVYQALVNGGLDGVQLVRPEQIDLLVERDSFAEEDSVLKRPMGFSYGFVKEDPGVFGPELSAFGHPGAGGALGWADPVRRLSIAYIPNAMDFHIRSPRTISICDAIYASLGE